jgi:hypothetical protein
MQLHLIKLCVGAESIEDLEAWIGERLAAARKAKRPPEHVHVTRMTPTRREDLLDGGSLYWVIKGFIQVRQRLLDIRPFEDETGIRRCGLVLDSDLVATDWQPRRPFQGWRYLDGRDAPPDLGESASAGLRPALRAELAALGLL